MSRKLTCLIEEQLVDKEVKNCLIPDFSTTTDQDVAVASMCILESLGRLYA
jgi:hypothetical protein